MKKIYYLSTCSTCQRILKEILPTSDTRLQDIKLEKILAHDLDEMKKLAGSYEALFSRRSMKYRAQDLHKKELNEKDYRKLILEEYTFLKRPVAVIDGEIFIGNSKKIISELAAKFSALKSN